jgi:hypothetical protein
LSLADFLIGQNGPVLEFPAIGIAGIICEQDSDWEG